MFFRVLVDKKIIKEAFKEALAEERQQHWVDPQTHYEHHRFVKGWVWTFNLMKKSAIVAFIGGFVACLGTLIWAGVKALIAIKGSTIG